jgi:integrase
MPKPTIPARTPKGAVSLLVSNGRLQLRFNYGGKRRYLSLGVPDTKVNRKAAELKIQVIERDIAYGEVDLTLARYQSHIFSREDTLLSNEHMDLRDLWERWVEYRKPQIEVKTLEWFKSMGNHINRFPTHSLEHSDEIKNWIIANISPDMGKRLITRINACCKWATKAGHISHNPFEGMASEIKLTKANQSDDFDIDPFTIEEQEILIEAYERHRHYSVYAPLIRFLLLTGCRPSEALGLRWRLIDDDKIFFKEAVVYANGKSVHKNSTKTGKDRVFPINIALKTLLSSLRNNDFNPDDLIFNINGSPINYNTFWRSWHGRQSGKKYYVGVVTNLVEKGLIKRYRGPYQCRHTFITQCLEAGVSIPQVAKWVGNSPEVIMRHYAGILTSVQVPVFF